MIEFHGMGLFAVFLSCTSILAVLPVAGLFISEHEKLLLCCAHLTAFGHIFYVTGCNYYQFDC